MRNVAVRPDSLEIGTAGKGGALKIYMDFMDEAECEQKIRAALRMRSLANDLMNGHVDPTTATERMHA